MRRSGQGYARNGLKNEVRRDVERVVLSLNVNGETTQLLVPVHKTLLEVLREDMQLTGTKHGCELGECGTCTVLVDGKPHLSCLVLPIQIEGRAITTVEGMASPTELHPLQTAFAELGAAQCGLHSRHPAVGALAARGESAAFPGGDQRSPRGEPVPLHRLHEDPRGGGARGGADAMSVSDAGIRRRFAASAAGAKERVARLGAHR